MAFFDVIDMTISFGGLVANSDVSIEAEEGQIVGLIGPNGAGKSTLFNAISGLIQPRSGRVLLEGEEILPLLPYERVARGIGRTFQNCRLFPSLPVYDNLLIAYHSRMRRSNGPSASVSFCAMPLAGSSSKTRRGCNIKRQASSVMRSVP